MDTSHQGDPSNHQVTILHKIVEDSGIDEKDQCCVCFGFTEKNKV